MHEGPTHRRYPRHGRNRADLCRHRAHACAGRSGREPAGDRHARPFQRRRAQPPAHAPDQVLYIIEGAGIVATREQEHSVAAGDVAHIPAGEAHWHGAAPGADMAHLSILPPCETRVVEG
ncbi:MAG: cupin domain-containing protein [Tepidiformaceae bacterium]